MKNYVTPHYDFIIWNQDVVTASGLESVYDEQSNEDIVDVGNLFTA